MDRRFYDAIADDAAGQPMPLAPLLAGLAHELNNPIAILTSMTALLEEDAQGTVFADRASRIRTAAERCGRVLQSFLDMAQQRAPRRRPVDLNQLARGVAELVGPRLETQGIAIHLDLARGLPGLCADPDQIDQVLLNLVLNAEQAFAPEASDKVITIRSRASAGRLVTLEVVDTGPGLPPSLEPRLFEPFFTTKRAGCGLGLTLSRQIVEAHGGRVRCASVVGGGACFAVDLPVRSGPASRSPKQARRPAGRRTRRLAAA